MSAKVFYPARVFHALRRYPVKHCQTCGRQLTPKLFDDHLESPYNFKLRKSCGRECMIAGPRTNKVQELEPKLLDILCDYRGLPLTYQELLGELDLSMYSRTTVRQALKNLEDSGRLRRSADGLGWLVPYEEAA